MKISTKYNFYIRIDCGYNSGMGHFSRAERLINILGVRKTNLILDSNNNHIEKYGKFKKIFLYNHPKKFISEKLDANKFIKIVIKIIKFNKVIALSFFLKIFCKILKQI